MVQRIWAKSKGACWILFLWWWTPETKASGSSLRRSPYVPDWHNDRIGLLPVSPLPWPPLAGSSVVCLLLRGISSPQLMCSQGCHRQWSRVFHNAIVGTLIIVGWAWLTFSLCWRQFIYEFSSGLIAQATTRFTLILSGGSSIHCVLPIRAGVLTTLDLLGQGWNFALSILIFANC